jgi:hypothetical protein
VQGQVVIHLVAKTPGLSTNQGEILHCIQYICLILSALHQDKKMKCVFTRNDNNIHAMKGVVIESTRLHNDDSPSFS